ncbi:MAG: PEGA domain-containing protein, partial [Kofleriaceae bacterium]|nr:PEGA domain-containing protein [Kofleriaceae bacterium]
MVIELPLGDVSVRIVKDTFEPLPVTIRVDKPRRGERGKPQRVEYNLLEAIGTLTIEGPAGAEVLIDGEVVGAAPGSFDVVAGGHRVELRVDGELGEMEFADVAVGETRTVRLSGPGAGGANAGGGDEPGGVGAGGGEGDVGGEVRAVRPASPRTTPLVVAHAVYQFDARSFT